MSNATSVSPPGKKEIKYTDKRVFAWVWGERGPVPQVWNKDFDQGHNGGKGKKIYLRAEVDDPKLTLDELIAMNPLPENWETL